MRKQISLALCVTVLFLLLGGCGHAEQAQIAATTLPVYDITQALCAGTELSVTRLVTEEVACLHDYSLNVRQVKAAEAAQVIVLSGAGLEDFMEDILLDKPCIDASRGISLICPEDNAQAEHDHLEHGHDHHHDQDPHIWLDPSNAMIMAENICAGLSALYPQHTEIFRENLKPLTAQLQAVYDYGCESLRDLRCRQIITFHDGFSYLAQAYGLTILEAVEEESGSEASARELIHLIELTEEHRIAAVFTEKNGSVSAAEVLSRETGTPVFSLDMAMSGESYLEAMYRNIDTLKEALG